MNATLTSRTKPLTPPLFGPVPAGFEVLRLAAAGECSDVWKLRETRTGRPFAWKRLKPTEARDPQAVARFRTEAHALSRCDGPGVVALHRDLTDETPPSLLLEWLEGTPLSVRLVRGEPLAPRNVFWIARQIAQGMHTLAAAGLAHGDLRPANVFVEQSGAVRLLDLASARPLEAASAGRESIAPEAVQYLAPERQTGAPYDPLAADVYSLGVILFELLCGRPPFAGENPDDVLRLHRQAKPRWIVQVPDIVEQMLRKEPLRRPRDLDAVIRELLDLELKALVRVGNA